MTESRKEASSGEAWQLYYWPLAGRGEFIRLLLVEAGQPFTDVSDSELIYQQFKAEQKSGWPVFAVPMLKVGDEFELGQTGTICRYIGMKFNLAPPVDSVDYWRADQICSTIMDFISEGRLAFHGKNFYESYYNQVSETQPYIDYFVENRLGKFLNHFEQILKFNSSNSGFLIGKSLTYCDLNLLHVLRAAESQFADAWKKMIGQFPLLAEFKTRIESRPRIKDYLMSDRCRPFEGNSMM